MKVHSAIWRDHIDNIYIFHWNAIRTSRLCIKWVCIKMSLSLEITKMQIATILKGWLQKVTRNWSVWLYLKLPVADIAFIVLSCYLHWLHFIRCILVKRCPHSASSDFLNGIFKSINRKNDLYVLVKLFSKICVSFTIGQMYILFLSLWNKTYCFLTCTESVAIIQTTIKRNNVVLSWSVIRDDSLRNFNSS